MPFMSTDEAAKKWGITPRRVQKYCSEGRICDAEKINGSWAIPVGAARPEDNRSIRYMKSRSDLKLPKGEPIFSIDLFCGPGGLATGLRWANIKPVIAVEWSDWTVKTYAASHDAEVMELENYLKDPSTLEPYLEPSDRPIVIHGDINKVEGELLLTLMRERYGLNRIDLVTGGAPCESFSMAGDRKIEDDRNQLYQNVLRLARATDARMFLFENVKGLFSKKKTDDARPGSMYQYVCDEFEEKRPGVPHYRLASRDKTKVLLKAINYGVPQNRERLFLVGMNEDEPDLEFSYPEPTHGPGCDFPYVTVKDALLDLPKLDMGEESEKYTFDLADVPKTTARGYFLSRMRGELAMPPASLGFRQDSLSSHKAPGHTARMLERIQNIGPGESMRTAYERLINEGKGDVAARCFPKKIYGARNRRLVLDKPSFTVTSHCLDEMIHPIADRGLTPREAARLQSFPDWYVFVGPYVKFHSDPEQDQYEQIGDAIPPLLAYAIGKELYKTLSPSATANDCDD